MPYKEIVWLTGTLQTPPVGRAARVDMGILLRLVQKGVRLKYPQSRPMPSIGKRCHELRVIDDEGRVNWRLVYRIDPDAIVVAHGWAKKRPQAAPKDLKLLQAAVQGV